ncbi:MAG: EI24 domain-containing protein [Betaproteobacteria bacterium]|nr:EI24 domain-containing protein [Betaproteobacteria bacterium]
MQKVIDAFWRAAVYCLHPRVIALSFLPLAITIVAALGLGYFFWNQAVEALRLHLEAWAWVQVFISALQTIGLGGLRSVLAPALLLFAILPFIVIACLLMVGFFMTPAMVALVGERRFPELERKKGASLLHSMAWTLGSTLMASLALVISVPLWMVPPLVLVLPPLIWGWLSYRVLSFDCLADHASADERRQIMREQRLHLLIIGLLTGYLSALPSILWASGAMFIAMAPLLVPLAIWIYTLVFAFSSLWCAHYCLARLRALRESAQAELPVVAVASAREGQA